MPWCSGEEKRQRIDRLRKSNGGERDGEDAQDFWKRIGFEPERQQRRLLECDGRRVILNCTRQWGKSTVTAARAVRQAWTEAEGLTLVVSPSARQTGEFLRKAGGFLRRLGARPTGDGDNAMSLLFPNGSRIVGLPGNEATVRGFSAAALIVMDEAARIPDELYLAIRPMLAVRDGDLWVMSTPYGKRGFFWETWTKGGEDWLRVKAPATECPRISARFLDEERRTMGDRWFRQEYLCEFTEREDSVFRSEDILAAIDEGIEPVAIAPFGCGERNWGERR